MKKQVLLRWQSSAYAVTDLFMQQMKIKDKDEGSKAKCTIWKVSLRE
jgi:hypothetical protein